MTAPRVSVLTATHNSSAYVAEAIQSVLEQTFTDFEYVIVDDASSDDSFEIVAACAGSDPRIRPIRNRHRAGAGGALNIALREARGDYVAILDADDLAMPGRLERQVAFMDAQPEFGAIGSAVRFIDGFGETLSHQRFPADPGAARWHLLFGASLLHSASLYRRGLIAELGGYSPQHGYVCDYELLVRIAERAKIGNLTDELACYRRHADQVSAVHRRAQNGQMLLLQYAVHARWLGRSSALDALGALLSWLRGTPPEEPGTAHDAVDTLQGLYDDYVAHARYSPADLDILAGECGKIYARLAHHAYRAHREISRACWRRARRLNPCLRPDLRTRRWLSGTRPDGRPRYSTIR